MKRALILTLVLLFSISLIVVQDGKTSITRVIAQDANTEYDPVINIRESISDGSGGFYVTGETQNGNIYISKFNVSGGLDWNNIIGGLELEELESITLDNEGNLIVLGETFSNDFQVNGFQNEFGGTRDLFIVKWDPNGTIIWSSYIGGSGIETIDPFRTQDIFIDSNNNILLIGRTQSNDFPVLNAFQQIYRGGGTNEEFDFRGDNFLIKISPSGESLWSSYLGGSGSDRGYLQIDLNDDLVVLLSIDAADLEVAGALSLPYSTPLGNGDADYYITKISSNGERQWGTYFGGSENDFPNSIHIDDQNDIIISGQSESVDFPTTPNAVQEDFGGWRDYTLTKFSSDGNVLWSTFFGGTLLENFPCCDWKGGDAALKEPTVFLDNQGKIIVSGRTKSVDLPLQNPLLDENPTPDIQEALVLAKFNLDGTLNFSTYLGGSDTDIPTDILVGTDNSIHITGRTLSSDFITHNSYQDQNPGLFSSFITKVHPNGTLAWSTYLGGSNRDELIQGLLNSQNEIIIVGLTDSTDFPIKNSESSHFGGRDGFISKLGVDGQLEWSHYFGGQEDEGLNRYGIIIGSSGLIAVQFSTNSYDLPSDDAQADNNRSSKEGIGYLQYFDQDGITVYASYLSSGNPPEKSDGPNYTLIAAILGSIILGGIAIYLINYLNKTRNIKDLLLNEQMDHILSPIFKNNPSLIYILSGSKIVDDKHLQQQINEEIPHEIFDFRYFMHPIRLSIVKLLDEYPSLTSIKIKEAVGLPWNEVTNHLDSLRKNGHIEIEQKFLEGSIRSIVIATPPTLVKFQSLKEILFQFLDGTPNLEKYLDLVSTIKHREASDDMYPVDQ